MTKSDTREDNPRYIEESDLVDFTKEPQSGISGVVVTSAKNVQEKSLIKAFTSININALISQAKR